MMDYWKSVTMQNVTLLEQPGTASNKLLSIAVGKMFGQTVCKISKALKV